MEGEKQNRTNKTKKQKPTHPKKRARQALKRSLRTNGKRDNFCIATEVQKSLMKCPVKQILLEEEEEDTGVYNVKYKYGGL